MSNIVTAQFNREQRELSDNKQALLTMLDSVRKGVEAGDITQAFVCYNSASFSETNPSGVLNTPASMHYAQSEGYDTFQLSGVLLHLIVGKALNG